MHRLYLSAQPGLHTRTHTDTHTKVIMRLMSASDGFAALLKRFNDVAMLLISVNKNKEKEDHFDDQKDKDTKKTMEK